MIKIDFNKPVLDLTGKEAKDENGNPFNCGKLLGNALISSAKGDALKFRSWAHKTYNGDILELDPSDFKTLYEFIDQPDHFVNLIKASLLEIMQESEMESKKVK